MMDFLRKKIIASLEFLHFKIFGYAMSEEMQKFIGNLGWITFGNLSAMGFLFITNLFAARWLGPEEYGRYVLIITAGQFLIIPMLLGMNTATIQKIASSSGEIKNKIMSTSFISVLITTILTFIFLFIFKFEIIKLLKINENLYYFVIMYGIVLSMKYICEAIFKGFHKFKSLSFLNISNALILFTVFFGYVFVTKDFTFHGYIIGNIIGLSFFSARIIWMNRKNISSFSLLLFKNLFSFGSFAMIGSVSGFILSGVDRFIVNDYLGTAIVGIYAVYLSASIFIAGQTLQIFLDVFFPTISAVSNVEEIFRKIEKIFKITFLPFLLINTLAVTFIIKIYGKQYGLNFKYVALFSLFGVLYFYQNIFWWLIASTGRKGIRFTSLTALIVGFLGILIMTLTVNYLGITGVILISILTTAILIFLSLIYLRKKDGEIN